MTLYALDSPPPKSSVSPYADGERGSSLRLALNSPESPLGFQPGSWGTGVLVPVRGTLAMVAPSTSLGCAWLPSPSAALLHVSSEECTQLKFLRDLFLLAGKRVGQLPLTVAKEEVEKKWWPPLECPRDLSLLGPNFLGIPGGAVVRPSPCCTAAIMALPCRGTTAPKALCVAASGSALVCQQL